MIFNVVVDALLGNWVSVEVEVEVERESGTEGFGRDVQRIAA